MGVRGEGGGEGEGEGGAGGGGVGEDEGEGGVECEGEVKGENASGVGFIFSVRRKKDRSPTPIRHCLENQLVDSMAPEPLKPTQRGARDRLRTDLGRKTIPKESVSGYMQGW